MLGGKFRRGEVIRQYAGKPEVRTAKTEIHRGQFRFNHKTRPDRAGAEPGQDAVPLPSPRDDLFLGDIGGQVPACLEAYLAIPWCSR